jgi:hypothetical protein
MPRFVWVCCAAMLWISTRISAGQTVPVMDVRLLRVEGAAVGVRRSAERLAEISKKISDNGNLSNLTALRTELTDLRRMVISARMAVTVAIEEMDTPHGLK